TNRWFGVRTFVLEIGELISGFVLCQVSRFVSGKASECVMNRETGLHFVKALAIKLTLDVAGSLRLNAVDRFVNNAETDLSIRRRRAVFVARQHGVRSYVARLEFFF